MTQKRFLNQTVIVTGAGEGIGYEVARQFCAEGASAIVNDILPERANAAAESIAAETGAPCLPAPGDVADIKVVRAPRAASGGYIRQAQRLRLQRRLDIVGRLL